jgi:glycosyltransferase involved in cell wall biosynthesis
VIPRAVDTVSFDPAAVGADRVAALRGSWEISPQTRVVLVPGRIAPRNGQMSMIDAARLLVGGGDRNIAFLFAGEHRGQARYARSIRRQARKHSIDAPVRVVGYCDDMPAALAGADVVVVPALEPPLAGHAAAEAQAMGRPVVASAVGVLPENLLCPSRMRDELRTGWLVRPGYLAELAQAVGAELALDITSYKALGARARQFAEFHVFAAKRCRSHSRSLYLAASSRRLTSIVSRS